MSVNSFSGYERQMGYSTGITIATSPNADIRIMRILFGVLLISLSTFYRREQDLFQGRCTSSFDDIPSYTCVLPLYRLAEYQ